MSGRLIEVFAGLPAAGPAKRLMLVGGGTEDEISEVGRALAHWQVEARVTMPGVVPDVERYLWASDIFVLPSVREGLSNSLVAAMACGLACGLACVAGAEAGGDQVLYGGSWRDTRQ